MTRFVLWVGALSVLLPSLASAQAAVQGQIIIQEQTPTTQAAPPPQAQVYVQQDSAYVQPTAPPALQCPEGSQMVVNAYGRPTCLIQVQRHHVLGGLLGGGIGLFAGGWVLTWISDIVVSIGGAGGCAISGSLGSTSCGWVAGDLSAFFDWGWVPILGPWVEMGYLWHNADGGMYAYLAVEGLLQAGGITMLIFGALGEDVMEFQPLPGYSLRVMPMMSGTTQGLSATLRF